MHRHLIHESLQLAPERHDADAEGTTNQPLVCLHLGHGSLQLAPERHDADAEGTTNQPLVCLHLGYGRQSGRGFTLLELLVVIAIVAVLMGTVIVGFTGADEERRLRALTEGIQARLELARQNALQRNREWGVHVRDQTYRFTEFDPRTGVWVPQGQRPFAVADADHRIEFDVEIEGFDRDQFGDPEEELPDIVLFSSGEVTPFTWAVTPEWDTIPWVLSSDGLAPVTAERRDLHRVPSKRRAAPGKQGNLAHLFNAPDSR